MLFRSQEIPESLIKAPGTDLSLYYTFDIEDGRITRLYVNSKKEGIQNCSMNIYLLERELLIDLVNTAFVHGKEYFERDILLPHINKLNVQAYKYDKYIARICDVKSYYDENMKLLDDYNLDSLFSGNPIYTKIRDDNPTRYIQDSKVRNVMVADGCIIEGEVENSVIFRGVKIAKGAKVKNCILMQDTVVEPGAEIEYLITDKNVKISAGKDMRGTDTHPVYISKYQEV